MKMLMDYLERATALEKLAASEENETFRAELLKQASSYLELAAKRAEKVRPRAPSAPDTSE